METIPKIGFPNELLIHNPSFNGGVFCYMSTESTYWVNMFKFPEKIDIYKKGVNSEKKILEKF